MRLMRTVCSHQSTSRLFVLNVMTRTSQVEAMINVRQIIAAQAW